LSLLQGAGQRLGGQFGRERGWCRAFEAAQASARRSFEEFIAESGSFCGLTAAACVSRGLAGAGTLFASNSMSIRLLDLAHHGSDGAIRVLCNRGASGIDGITSTALGVAAAGQGRTILLTGDLALLHDLSGLVMASQVELDLLIVVLDDDGGGIFSFLPIAEQGEAVRFERLFGTPHGLDLARLAALFELDYARVTSRQELDEALSAGLRRGGISLVHVPLDRERNQAQFRKLLERIVTQVEAEASV
jgi:2-succinyl-5-enolpyruvyl-6-hydroxy-3-cyclohexene-1-carboxylate synthase